MPDIKIAWKGKTYTIPESKAFLAGEAVEEVVTLAEMASWGRHVRFHKLARAFAALAGVAGVRVTPEDVLKEMMAQLAKFAGNQEGAAELFAVRAIAQLQEVLVGALPEAMRAAAADGEPGKTAAASSEPVS